MSDSTVTVSFVDSLVSALKARNSEAFSKDTLTAINNAERSKTALDTLMMQPAFSELATGILTRARISDFKTNKRDFVAVKVLVKLVSTMYALSTGVTAELDPYTATIGYNLVHNREMTNKSNYVCLSKSIEYDALDRVQNLTKKRDCSVGTASTQASSTRQALMILGIADGTKDRDSDTLKLFDNDRAKLFVSLFAKKSKAKKPEAQPEAKSEAEQQPVSA
jgi:hypothetical protein